MEGKVEVLAPAGSWEAMKAGIAAGADAVYAGGTRYGARAYAENFGEDELLRGIDYAHVRGRKVYLTVNTLLTDQDVEEKLHGYLSPYYRQGLDAVIVQDVGVMRFIHERFPKLAIHASTQMTLTMAEGTDLLAGYGVSRVIPARELSIKELGLMRAGTDMEMEVFVHGALCYSYSGQCHMSAVLGGRSGNKGKCAGPCRLSYAHRSKEGHYFCLKDLCSLSSVGELVGMGMDSFKIEGRMKKPEYVALTVQTYRKYIDRCMELGVEGYREWIADGTSEYREDVRNLMDVYNRGGFTNGYLAPTQESMLAVGRPNHYGVYVGKVAHMKGSVATIQLEEAVHAGDVLEFRNEAEKALYEYTVGKQYDQGDGGTRWEDGRPRDGATVGVATANTGRNVGIKVGDGVYRTRNQTLLDEIATQMGREAKRRVWVRFTAKIGKPAVLEMGVYGMGGVEVDGGVDDAEKGAGVTKASSVRCCGDVVAEARRQPVTKKDVEDKLVRMGNTPFVCVNITIQLDKGAFLPLGGLNALRRKATEELERRVVGEARRMSEGDGKGEVANVPIDDGRRVGMDAANEFRNYRGKTLTSINGNGGKVDVSVCSGEQFKAVLGLPSVRAIYLSTEGVGLRAIGEMVGTGAGDFHLLLPYIFRERTYRQYREWWAREGDAVGNRIKGFLICNFEEYHFVKTVADPGHTKEWGLHYNMYVENREARRFWMENGIDHVEGKPWYGYTPLMFSANCLLRNTESCTRSRRVMVVEDGKRRKFRVVNHCDSCYNVLYGEHPVTPLTGRTDSTMEKRVDSTVVKRIDFTMETKEEVERVMSRLRMEWEGRKG